MERYEEAREQNYEEARRGEHRLQLLPCSSALTVSSSGTNHHGSDLLQPPVLSVPPFSNSTRAPHEHACELFKRIGPRRSKQKRTGRPRLRTPTACGRKNTNLPAYDDKDHMEYEASSCFKHSGSDTQGRTTRWRRTNGGRSADTTMLIFYSDDASHHVPKRHYPPRSTIQDGHANHRRPAVEARESTAIQPWRHARQPTPQRTRP